MSIKDSETTRKVAAFVAETPASAIPAKVRERAVFTIADTFATTAAGVGEPSSVTLRGALLDWAAPGPSTVVGSSRRADPPTAALLNSASAHALDYDSISFAVSGFVGSATIAAIAALVEDGHVASGEDVVTAYCLGWEGAAAIARGVNPLHYAKGWHPTATLGRFAAALGACRLLGLDAEQTAMALGVAVAESSGVKTMIGNMLNAYHVGTGARVGVVAARLAAGGFVSNPSALEAEQGFFNLYNGRGNYDSEAVVTSLGQTWDLVNPGPIMKVYPCCGLIHSGLDAVISLVVENNLDVGDITDVEVLVHEYVPGVMHVDVPETGYGAKFSIGYCIAAGLRDRRCDLSSFASVDEGLVELGRIVRTSVHPDLHGGETFLGKEFTEVRIQTRQGLLVRRVERMANRGTGENFSPEDLSAKFADCLAYGGVTADPGVAWSRFADLDSAAPFAYWSMFEETT